MTESNDQAGSNTNGAGSADAPQPNVQILGQYIKDLSFENPKAPGSLQGQGQNPKMKIEVNVGAQKVGNDAFESAITFNATATSDDGPLYELEVVYAGLAKLQNVPDTAIQQVLLINIPMLIFPFLRRVVSDLTREGGFPPLNLEPIDFGSLYAKNMEQQQKDVMKKVAAETPES